MMAFPNVQGQSANRGDGRGEAAAGHGRSCPGRAVSRRLFHIGMVWFGHDAFPLCRRPPRPESGRGV